MVPGQLAQALSALAIAEDGGPVEFERLAADVASFEPGAAHAGADPLDNKVALQFRDRPDDDYDGAAQRAAGVDLFSEADELDVEAVELVEHFEEVLHGAPPRPGRADARCPPRPLRRGLGLGIGPDRPLGPPVGESDRCTFESTGLLVRSGRCHRRQRARLR